METRIHVRVPRTAQKGEVVRLMTKLNHPMESGWRKRQNGEPVPKDLIGEFVCLFEGKEVFRAEMDSGTAGNPYLSFFVRVEKSGTFQFLWRGDRDQVFHKEAAIRVV